MPLVDDIINEHKQFVTNYGDRGSLPEATSGKLAVITCMDHRINHLLASNAIFRQAFIIRNAGGRAQEGLRSLLIAQHMFPEDRRVDEIYVIHHTQCGMATTPEHIHETIQHNIRPHDHTPALDINWMTLGSGDQSLRQDVRFLRRHMLFRDEYPRVTGWMFHIEDGELRPLREEHI